VKTLKVTEKTGGLIAIKDVDEDNDLMIINKSGITIRMNISKISTLGRATQGVRLIKLNEGDAIASVAKVDKLEEQEEENDETANGDAPTDLKDESGNNEAINNKDANDEEE